jgi:signal transduction histidine kinase
MNENNNLKFRISSALKDLIGKELITDQYIAIFELVKNSFDAYSSNVKIIFDKLKTRDARIIIIDDGKGMSINDIENKWLFVAYSAKKDGTEDIDYEESIGKSDYRNRIRPKRIFAGAKGVGRFSCDRLGTKLNLTTIKDNQKQKIENIVVNWEDFEQDSKKEFINIDVEHNTLIRNEYNIEHGTVLEITGLRDRWDRSELLRLKRSLEKLINPNQENDSNIFSIEIVANEELKEDEREYDRIINKSKKSAIKNNIDLSIEDINWHLYSNMVNGVVRNSLFETLGIKSTQIVTEISKNGKYIETQIKDRGVLIYKIKENNDLVLTDIKIVLFYLNPTAKNNFTRLMGMEPVNYGSVFMYKNGFRIYPYGEQDEDLFGIDKRKAQGHSRYLGTREILGRIEIFGENNKFKESTSRDGGLIKNESYEQLQKFFVRTIRRLEKYVVEVSSWGTLDITDETKNGRNLTPEDTKNQIENFISTLTSSKNILEVEYDSGFLEKVKEKQKTSVSASLQAIKETAIRNHDQELAKRADQFDQEFRSIVAEKTRLEIESEEKALLLEMATEELDQKEKLNLFLKSVSTLDINNIISLHHHIGIISTDIDAQLLSWNRKINNGYLMTPEEVRSLLSNIGILNTKILSVSKFATKANFNLQSEQLTTDLFTFIDDYISNIYMEFINDPVNIKFINKNKSEFTIKFKPIEITIVLDNILNNSRKAKARNIEISVEVIEGKALIKFKDDGKGLDNSIRNSDVIFEMGFTTTSGSGIGLYHVKQIVSDLKGNVSINNNITSGFELLLEVKK